MKCTIPEISWHNREPVLSVDIHPISNYIYKLASGGGDTHVLIWQMTIEDNGAVKPDVISDLTRHQRAVNAVRWSPSGQYLASADDDANIIIWQLKTDNLPLLEGDTGDKEVWIIHKVLRGHKEDIYDLCWSLSGLKLFSGSVDNTAILWDLGKGKMEHILSDHKGFVQGVSWDPKNEVISTISTDRICRLFDTSGKHVKARISKGKLPVPSNHPLFDKEVKYFHDDTFKSFFRRLQFSPDGSILVVPSGHMENEDCKKVFNATLIFTLDNLNMPAAILPISKQNSTCVRFCPTLFEHREEGPDPIISLAYRMIFAVGTDHDIILYDTQQSAPFARFQDIHYTRLTDLTWSNDGLLLVASSTDGFCSLITFEPSELGVPYTKDDTEMEDSSLNTSKCEETIDKDENIDITNKEIVKAKEAEKKKPSFLEQWAAKNTKNTKKSKSDTDVVKKKDEKEKIIEIVDDGECTKILSQNIRDEINKLIPKRSDNTIVNKFDDKTIAKPIEIRRKPKNNEEQLGDKKVIKQPSKIDCTLAKEEENNCLAVMPEIIKNEEGEEVLAPEIKNEISKLIPRRSVNDPWKTEDKTVAKPIDVRRYPRKNENSTAHEEKKSPEEKCMLKAVEIVEDADNSKKLAPEIRNKINKLVPRKSASNTFKSEDKTVAKPIEFRRKSKNKDEETLNGKTENKRIDKCLEAKPIAVKRKPSETLDLNKSGQSTKTVKLTESEIKEKSVELKKINSDIETIVLEDSSDAEEMTKKQPSVLKAKDDKSHENSSSTSATKTFAFKIKFKDTSEPTTPVEESTPSTKKSSTGKRKKEETPKAKPGSAARKKLPTTPQSNSLLNFLNSSGSKSKKSDKVCSSLFYDQSSKKSNDGPDLRPMDEDCTEDFVLQLEDSEDEKMEVDNVCLKEKSSNSELVEDNDSSKTKSETQGNGQQHTPRRVPFITLASPKTKNQQQKHKPK